MGKADSIGFKMLQGFWKLRRGAGHLCQKRYRIMGDSHGLSLARANSTETTSPLHPVRPGAASIVGTV